jgi:hypothetical protein
MYLCLAKPQKPQRTEQSKPKAIMAGGDLVGDSLSIQLDLLKNVILTEWEMYDSKLEICMTADFIAYHDISPACCRPSVYNVIG